MRLFPTQSPCPVSMWPTMAMDLISSVNISSIFFMFLSQIFRHFVDQVRHVNAVLDGLIQNEPDFRRVAQIHGMGELTPDIGASALFNPSTVSFCACSSPSTLIYALQYFRSGVTSTATTLVMGWIRGSLISLRMILLNSFCTSPFILVFFNTILSHNHSLFLLLYSVNALRAKRCCSKRSPISYSIHFLYLGTSTIVNASTVSSSLISLNFSNTRPHS